MQQSHAHSPCPLMRGTGALLGLLILSACSSTGPSSPFGTYNLAACLFLDSIPRPIPCAFEQPTQGDSLRFDGGTFTLGADSTWARTTFQTDFLNGSWGSTASYTTQGTYSPLPSSSHDLAYQLHTPGIPDDPRFAALVGDDTLSVGVLLYTR
jgi:hypothetical protein